MVEDIKEMAKKIPLSREANFKLRLSLSDFLVMGILLFSIGGIFFVSGILGRALPIVIIMGIFMLGGLILIPYGIRKGRAAKKQIIEDNFNDWLLSQKVYSVISALKNNQLINDVDSLGLQDRKVRPVRIDYYSQSQLKGELEGAIRGFGFFVFRGEFSGKIKADLTPNLTDQNAVIISVDEGGESYRLIFPSVPVLRSNLTEYFKRLAEQYGTYTYTNEAIIQLKEGINKIFAQLNYQRIVDYLVTRLAEGQKPTISIKGMELKEGTFLVAQINCEGRGSEAVIPLALLNRIQSLLEKQLSKELPPIYSLPSGS